MNLTGQSPFPALGRRTQCEERVMEIWEVCVSTEWYPGKLRAGAWEDLGLLLGHPQSRWPRPQELLPPPPLPAGRVRSPRAASAPALSWHHGRGRTRGSLPRPPSSWGLTRTASPPPSASWGWAGLFLPCSPSPQLGCSWCRGVRTLSWLLLPPWSSLPRRHALLSPMEGCLWRGLCPALLRTPLSPRGHAHHTPNWAYPISLLLI